MIFGVDGAAVAVGVSGVCGGVAAAGVGPTTAVAAAPAAGAGCGVGCCCVCMRIRCSICCSYSWRTCAGSRMGWLPGRRGCIITPPGPTIAPPAVDVGI